LPYGKPGVIAATMLGLGRALGETMALALTLGTTFHRLARQSSKTGGNTIAANIVHQFGEGRRQRPVRAHSRPASCSSRSRLVVNVAAPRRHLTAAASSEGVPHDLDHSSARKNSLVPHRNSVCPTGRNG